MIATIRRIVRRAIVWNAASPRRAQLTTYRDRHIIALILAWCPLPLPTLLRFFGSDKHRAGQHSYGYTYHELFRRFRFRNIKLLEIGVFKGDSLLAWRAFFPFGTVVACDIEPKQHLAFKRTRVHRIDQGSSTDLARLCQDEAPFDIIIDDGSHLSKHQISTFYLLFDHLKSDGVYVIEDVQTSFWPGIVAQVSWDGTTIDDPKFTNTCVGEFLELSKYLNHAEFVSLNGVDTARISVAKRIRRIAFEHNLIIVMKGANDEPSNFIRRPA